MSQDYKIQGSLAIPEEIRRSLSTIGFLEYSERSKKLIADLNQEFQGNELLAFPGEFKTGQLITHSNTPRALYMAWHFKEHPSGLHLSTHTENIRYKDSLPNEGNGTYSDLDGIPVFPNEGENKDLWQRVKDITGKRPKKTPFIVSGLKPVRDSSMDSDFNLEETEHMKVEYAPWLKENGWVKYDSKKEKIVRCKPRDEGAVYVVVPSDQSGLGGLYRNWDDVLNARNDNLLNASEYGRVQVVQDPKSLTEKISE